MRAARQHSERAVHQAKRVLDELRFLALDEALLRSASELGDRTLRSLDAIHIASAQTLAEDVEVFVTYDERLARAAVGLGFPVASPI
jgi:uncharacterized protein